MDENKILLAIDSFYNFYLVVYFLGFSSIKIWDNRKEEAYRIGLMNGAICSICSCSYENLNVVAGLANDGTLAFWEWKIVNILYWISILIIIFKYNQLFLFSFNLFSFFNKIMDYNNDDEV